MSIMIDDAYLCPCGCTNSLEMYFEEEDNSLVCTEINPEKCTECGREFRAYATVNVEIVAICYKCDECDPACPGPEQCVDGDCHLKHCPAENLPCNLNCNDCECSTDDCPMDDEGCVHVPDDGSNATSITGKKLYPCDGRLGYCPYDADGSLETNTCFNHCGLGSDEDRPKPVNSGASEDLDPVIVATDATTADADKVLLSIYNVISDYLDARDSRATKHV